MKRVSFFILLALRFGFFVYDVTAQSIYENVFNKPFLPGDANFPDENGKYRMMAQIDYISQMLDGTINYVDSSIYTYKNSTTNALESIVKYRSDSFADWDWNPVWTQILKQTFFYDTTDVYTEIIMHKEELLSKDRVTTRRDTKSRIISRVYQTWLEADQSFRNEFKNEYIYDDLNRVVSEDMYIRAGSDGWKPETGIDMSCRIEYMYVGSSNRIKAIISYQADPIPPYTKKEYEKTEVTYNADGLETKIERYRWHNQSSQWLIKEMDRIYYSGTVIDSVENWENNAFDNDAIDLNKYYTCSYIYNDNKQLISQVYEYENYTYRDMYTYGGIGISKFAREFFSENEWHEAQRSSYQYNTGGYITRYNDEFHQGMGDDEYWGKFADRKYYYEYNEGGYIDMYQEVPVLVSVQDQDNFFVEIFPNPTTSTLNVIHNMTEAMNFEIVSLDGQVVKRGVIHHGFSNKIKLDYLSDGQYLLLLKGVNGAKSYSFVKTNK